MFTPESYGGHARYTWELMCALRASAPRSELNLSLVTSTNLEREFREADYAIYEVLPPLHEGPFPNRLHWAASRVAHYSRRDATLLRFLRDLGDVDVVHYQEPPLFASYYYSRLRRLGMHPLFTVHNLLPHRDVVAGTGWLTKRLSTLAWRRCSALFVHSDALGQQLLKRIGRGAPPIVTVPHGVWRVPPASPTTSEDRLRRKQLLLFGALRRNKGIDLMLDALEHVPGARLTIAGEFESSALRDEVLSRLRDKTLPVRLIDRFIPEDEAAKLFAESSLAVLSYTNFHAQSGVLHLALSHGVPAVVTDVGALGEFVRREQVGTVSPPHDASALAQAILRALEPATYETSRQNCLRLSASLSWKEAAERTLRCYQDVLRAKAVGSGSPRLQRQPGATERTPI
jgi:glycosyltransferase involved in cell wall biosynthesis